MLKLIIVAVLLVASVIGTALFLRRNKKVVAEVDAIATKAGTDINSITKKL